MSPLELVIDHSAKIPPSGQVRSDAKTALAPAMSIHGLSVSYGEAPVLFSVDADFPQSSRTAIIGPNGAGKSSLLRAALQLQPRLSGEVMALGGKISKNRARIAYVPQRAAVDWSFPVRVIDVVQMGLFPELGLFRWLKASHRERSHWALKRMGMEEFSERQIGALSGGQRQRVFLARALVQQAELFILDEPFTGVDAATEAIIAELMTELASKGKTIISVHHDLETVGSYFDRVLILNRVKIAEGPVAEALTEQNLSAAYSASSHPVDFRHVI